MRVLVDTSVWIRGFAGHAPYIAELDRLLSLDRVTGHEMVYAELLIGDPGGRREFLSTYRRMHQAGTVPHDDVLNLVNTRGLRGRGVGWVDLHILASAVLTRCSVWTADRHFAAVAIELDINYEIPR